MKVTLVDYTGKGMYPRYAAELMIFTKSTRLTMSPRLLSDISEMNDLEINNELEYMSNTIPSSWEFCNYTFMIENCTRAFTHQLVRNRQGSYAQQTMRVLNVSGFSYEAGPSIKNDPICKSVYKQVMDHLNLEYKYLIKSGAAVEDARGILPTNIHTNIVAAYNLRTVSELVSKRSSPRTQGEYREFIEAMRAAVLEVHPWAHHFLRNRKQDAASQLDKILQEQFSGDDLMAALKLVDMLRS